MDDIAPTVVVVLVLTAMGTGVGLDRGLGAQPQPADTTASSPVLESSSISIDVAEERHVTATYVFDLPGPASSPHPANVSGTMWSFPEREVEDLSASVNGRQVTPSVTRRSAFSRVNVPVLDETGDELTVRLKYSVTEPRGRLRVPLWVPEAAPRGPDRSVTVRVRLPPDSDVRGVTFPRIDDRAENGRLLRYNLVHVPGFVSLRYAGRARRLPVGPIASAVGVAMGALAAGAWWFLDQRQRGEAV